jgi:molybdopterin synthase catalytic subunit
MYFSLTLSPLDVSKHFSNVSDTECGGVSIFIGTVRDSFQGKKVLYLEYSAYEKMVHSQVSKIFLEAKSLYPRLKHISVEHRLGRVPAGEASIIIATSSPDRSSSLSATSFLIESLKSQVPIWKKEFGEDWSEWKANTEWKVPSQ